VLVISKIDAMPYFNFSLEDCRKRAKMLNPRIEIYPLSAKTGDGMDAWIAWLKEEVRKWKEDK
jgi:hydrogenase nickel incorporation protein HypB